MRFWAKVSRKNVFWGFLAFAGWVLYVYYARAYFYSMPSMLDEGAYLYKGLMFAEGIYKPFQAYGPWTNKMPYLFYFYGILQKIFGPGLLTGRLAAFGMSSAIVMFLWLLIRRLSTAWQAMIGVWILALTPSVAMAYSYATSQVVVVFFLTLGLFFLLGEDRMDWQIVLGGIFLAISALMRIVMTPVLLFAGGYVYKEFGRKQFWLFMGAFGIVFFAGYMLYWPEILRLWQGWLPASIVQLLPGTKPNFGIVGKHWNPMTTPFQRWYSLSDSFYSQAALLWGLLAGFLFLRKHLPARYTNIVRFWGLFYGVLWALLAWGALGHNYCVFCLQSYQQFITPVALLVASLFLPYFKELKSILAGVFSAFFAILLSAVIGFGAFKRFGYAALNFPIPRIKNMRILPGWTSLWGILSGKTAWTYKEARVWAPVMLAVVFSICFVGLLFLLTRMKFSRGLGWASSILYAFGILFLAIGFDPYRGVNTCHFDINVPKQEEKIGQRLNEVIPDESLVYWAGGSSISPLLYVDNIRTFPQQYNGGFGRKVGGDTDLLLKYGFYNGEADTRWLNTADYLIVNQKNFPRFADVVSSSEFTEIPFSQEPLGCQSDTFLRIFKRVK